MTRHPAILAFAAMLAAQPALASVEEALQPGEAPVVTTWYAARSAPAQEADREYVAGMRPHHAGALTMSADYLRDPGRASPLLQALARAIVVNQRFEIGVLDEIARNLDAPAWHLPFGLALQPVATEGMTSTQRFFKAPIPAAPAHAVGPVSESDVRFAKAMILHHEAAVEMARDYLRNPLARNGFLGLMNVDIVTDQTQEITLMRRVIAAFPGDPDRVEVPASMVHGMEGMRHGGHATPAPAAPPASSPGPQTAHGAAHRHGAAAPLPPEAPPRAPARPAPTQAPRGADSHRGHH
jgi:uncharacterized protein (DUF305 family)